MTIWYQVPITPARKILEWTQSNTGIIAVIFSFVPMTTVERAIVVYR